METLSDDVISQLVKIYFEEENWHDSKLSIQDAVLYHDFVFNNGNIIVVKNKDEVVGYLEFWRLNFENWGKYVCGVEISPLHTDVKNGNIAVVNNIWIKKEFRRGDVFKQIKERFYRVNSDCDYYVGHALRKKTQPIKVFKKSDLSSSLFRGE